MTGALIVLPGQILYAAPVPASQFCIDGNQGKRTSHTDSCSCPGSRLDDCISSPSRATSYPGTCRSLGRLSTHRLLHCPNTPKLQQPSATPHACSPVISSADSPPLSQDTLLPPTPCSLPAGGDGIDQSHPLLTLQPSPMPTLHGSNPYHHFAMLR